MRIFQQSQDREHLAHVEEQGFVEACKEQFTERSLAATNAAKVKTLSALSYLPNAVSAVTAGFFVLYLLSGYSRTVAVVLGALLLLIVITVEVGKRALITGTAKDRYTIGKVSPLAVAALVVLFGASMAASYMGGKALVVETAAPPPRPHNAQIDSLNTLLQAELATIDRLQRTTWKGKVTSDAVKGINASKRVQSALVDRIQVLEAQDDAAHGEALGKHTAKHLNFGYILGVLAALADLFLLGMLWAKWHLQYQVAAVHAAGTRKGEETGKIGDAALEAIKAATRAAEDAALAATAATHAAARPRIDTYGHNPPHLNNAPAEAPRIGFTANRQAHTENRNTENRNTENRNTETVTVVEREVIELTDRVKNCAHCGQRFRYFNSRAKYCSDECRVGAWEQRTGRAWKGGRS